MRTTIILGLLVASSAFAQPASQPLLDALEARIRDFPGKVSLCARNLDTGQSIGIRESWANSSPQN